MKPGLRRPPAAGADPAAVKPAGHVGTRRDSVKPVPCTGAHAGGPGGFHGSLGGLDTVSGVGPAGHVLSLRTVNAPGSAHLCGCGTGDPNP